MSEWQLDKDVSHCPKCRVEFSLFNRRHHCRACGLIYCYRCSNQEIVLPRDNGIFRFPTPPSGIPTCGLERVCDACYVFYRAFNIATATVQRFLEKP